AAREAYRRAVELAREQLDVNPNDAEVLGELAKYHAMLGDRENALECLGRALEIGPSKWNGWRNPGRVGRQVSGFVTIRCSTTCATTRSSRS
ncbi:MAG: tetratricopeptide repeat protein, partial [Planctomycetota bacterium]